MALAHSQKAYPSGGIESACAGASSVVTISSRSPKQIRPVTSADSKRATIQKGHWMESSETVPSRDAEIVMLTSEDRAPDETLRKLSCTVETKARESSDGSAIDRCDLIFLVIRTPAPPPNALRFCCRGVRGRRAGPPPQTNTRRCGRARPEDRIGTCQVERPKLPKRWGYRCIGAARDPEHRAR